MKLQSGHEVVPLEGAEKEAQTKHFQGYTKGLVRLTPGRWLFPAHYTNYADKLYNFKFRSTDVAIITYPKCGTNWTQEIIWTMRNNPNFDNPNANQPLIVRSPFLEFDKFFPIQKEGEPTSLPYLQEAFKRMCPGKDPAEGMNLLIAEHAEDPRTIKCHLPFTLMDPEMLDTCKVVYVARNPKDVIVSYHHHSRILDVHGYVGSFEEFVQYFVDDDLVYGPYWLHLKEAWERRNHPNMHIMFFEDMKANPLEEFRKLNVFLGTNLTEAQLEGIVRFTSFSNMKAVQQKHFDGVAREAIKKKKEEEETTKTVKATAPSDPDEGRGFYRKGVVGDWKNRFGPELEDKVNHWIETNMKDVGFDFKYAGK